jgi:hypothetical protein
MSPELLMISVGLNGNGIWRQPIVVERDSYDFKVLNSWGGKVTINEKEKYILSSLIGAG